MTPAETSRADKLLGLARERFAPELRPVEEQIVRHSCGFDDPKDDDPALAWRKEEPEPGAEGSRLLGPYVGPGRRPLRGWQGPEVRAGFLRWLLLDGEAGALLDPKGLRVWGARLTEPLSLNRCRVGVVVEFRQCLLERDLEMDWGRMREVTIADSTVLGTVWADGTTFEGSVFAGSSGFGDVYLRGAVIQGQLVLSGSRVAGVLELSAVTVTGSALLDEGFECGGEMTASAASIGGQLNMMGARLGDGDEALNMDGVSVGQSVYLSDGFACAGRISMIGAKVGKMVYCHDSRIRRLDAEALEANQFMWRDLPPGHEAELSLRLGKVQTLLVNGSSLAATRSLRLNHLQMQAITNEFGGQLKAADCARWLNLQPLEERAEAQPWMQMSRIREAAGDKSEAKRLVYELRVRQLEKKWKGNGGIARTMRTMRRMYALLEESQFWILAPLLFLLLVGTGVFHAYRAHFAETGEAAYRATHTACAAGEAGGSGKAAAGVGRCPAGAAYPRFSSFVYTLENVLPVVKLGQDAAWAPRAEKKGWSIYWVLAWVRWLLILSGWAMGIVLGAAIGARFRT